MVPIANFDAGVWNETPCKVYVVSDSTIPDFGLNEAEKIVKFNVTGETDLGFCRVTIPNVTIQHMCQYDYTTLVDNSPPLESRNWTDTENTYLYFTYQHLQHQITIIPEHTLTVVLLTLVASATATINIRRIRKSPRLTSNAR